MIYYSMFRQDEDLTGVLVISKCGRDAGESYVVVSAAGNNLLVANGKNRKILSPKKKNRVHLFVTKQVVPDVKLLLQGEPVSSNLKLAEFIKNNGRKV